MQLSVLEYALLTNCNFGNLTFLNSSVLLIQITKCAFEYVFDNDLNEVHFPKVKDNIIKFTINTAIR
jgi:hypothetical protein